MNLSPILFSTSSYVGHETEFYLLDLKLQFGLEKQFGQIAILDNTSKSAKTPKNTSNSKMLT